MALQEQWQAAGRRVGWLSIRPLVGLAVALAGGLLVGGGSAAEPDGVRLGVTRVALFSSGVGYFECDARVNGSATATLNFRTEQINDILKSLVVQDFDGGRIQLVGYAARDPIEKTLRSFGVDITGRPSLPQLLDQLRGQPVEISGTRKLRGLIVGVETRTTLVGGERLVETPLLNLLTDAGLQQVEFGNIDGVKLQNERVANELRQALATLALGHDADKKGVTIAFDGDGARRVRAAYLLEAPLWKTSYRLMLPREAGGRPYLQGWAVVENATEEDWRNVRLSLVSGRPISFRMDLYTPLYVPRPLEVLELYAALRPPQYESGVLGGRAGLERDQLGSAAKLLAQRARPAAPAPAMSEMAMRRNDGVDEAPELSLEGQGVESVAAALEAGELFEYEIQAPVSLARQHSAMLPIVNEPVTGEKVSIYNPATHAKHPLNGLELTNATKLNLMQGPVTIFDADLYAGDAKLPDLKPGEKRLLAYALDLGAEVLVKQQPRPEELVSLRIAKGTFIRRYRYLDTREYEVLNKADRDKVVLIEQSFAPGWQLVEPAEPYERTQNVLRFKVSVPALETIRQVVQLERVGDVSIALTNLPLDQIEFYMRGRSIAPQLLAALGRVVELRRKLDEAVQGRQQLEQLIQEAASEQGRVRENIRALPQNADAYKRQVTKLDTLESELERLRARSGEVRAAEETARRLLEDFLLNLEVG